MSRQGNRNRQFNRDNNNGWGSSRSEQQRNSWRNTRGRGQHPRRIFTHDGTQHKMSFQVLQSLEENYDVQEILQILLSEKVGLHNALEEQSMNGNVLVIILRILVKVIQTPFAETKLRIFDLIFRESTYAKQLRKFILDIPTHDASDKDNNNLFWSDTDTFWYNILKLSNDIITQTPTLAFDVLPQLLKGITQALPNIEKEHSLSISKEIIEKFASTQQTAENLKNKMKKRYHKQTDKQTILSLDYEDDWSPPEDFRMISVYPEIEEMRSATKVFLRRNKIKGPYKNVEHYLDVQFRLLREDFVLPLRNGINEYFKDTNRRKFDDIRIYKPVRFVEEENVNELRCFRLKYDLRNSKATNTYEYSKQFMYGSLICFTKDDFTNIIFGKIVSSDPELIKNKEIFVGFQDNVDISFIADYIMVESKVYFEPYYCVLSALQTMETDEFPLERYLIYAESNLNHPSYLTCETLYDIQDEEIQPLSWSNPSKLYTFNQSQQEAFKAALTQELSIIQGPPGTGKTYLGLKIAQTLILNPEPWYKNSPILVICYTNHALDQFLGGLLDTTSDILRIGGQSKIGILNQFNIKNKHEGKSAAFYQIAQEFQSSLCKLADLTNNISTIKKYDTYISFDEFKKVIDLQGTWFSNARSNQIKCWLFEEFFQNPTMPLKNTSLAMNVLGKNVEVDEPSTFSDNIDTGYVYKDWNRLNINYNEPDPDYFVDADQKNQFELKYNNYLKYHLDQISKMEHVHFNGKRPDLMSPKERWIQYKYFVELYLAELEFKQSRLNDEYKQKYKLYNEQKNIEDLKLMKNVLVVGMTTTSAARLRPTLIALKSPIVIVEEAAEVLEAHIICALTDSCQQLILIGDHKQLRPKVASYEIETEYRMGTSLFERMINNNVQCHTLNVQHRMRPEICDLVRPSIYNNLEDHNSVLDRPNIAGVESNLYFIDHKNREESCGESSKLNRFESIYLVKLAKYLILNGHKPENITIIAAYLGQMFEIQKFKRQQENIDIVGDVHVTVLDNYQGEENDIILLSLVRNNEENQNGFLKTENRVCVALSRARNGLYIMGNMDQLCTDNNSVWLKIRDRLLEHDALGTSLKLKCQLHKKSTRIAQLDDFLKVQKGGCDIICDAALTCGHTCKSICHIYDENHTEYKCEEICRRPLCTRYDTHLCERFCYQKCRPCYYKLPYQLPCMHDVELECHIDVEKYKCVVQVSTQLPCGHVVDKPCHMDANVFPCPRPCEVKVEPCGHTCTLSCHIRNDPDHTEYKCQRKCVKIRKGCSTQEHYCRRFCYQPCELCIEVIRKPRSVCSHFYDVECCRNVDVIKCEKPCKIILPCSHKCTNKCFEKCGPCKKKVSRVIEECGHEVKVECFKNPTSSDCPEKCTKILNCGHKCLERCRDKCTEKCLGKKPCSLLGVCGHIIREIPCSEISDFTEGDENLLKYCTEPCNTNLKCNHMCQGTCGECFQGRIHKACQAKCDLPMICNHPCPNRCGELCGPCDKNCTYRCEHNKCKRKCGDICTKCKNICPRRCQHRKCKNICGDLCSIEPCVEPCSKMLKCGHPCIGFCGDPCPALCRICDNEKLTTIASLETEDMEVARFVQLNDCNHIIESSVMEELLNMNTDEFQIKDCPVCNTPIVSTRRYSDYIKQAFTHIRSVKSKCIDERFDNNEIRFYLSERLERMLILSDMPPITLAVEKLTTRMDLYRTNNVLLSIPSKTVILEQMVDVCRRLDNIALKEAPQIVTQVNLILEFIVRGDKPMAMQEIEDIRAEITRLERMIEIHEIRTNRSLETGSDIQSTGDNLDTVENLVLSFKRYTEETDQKVSELLRSISISMHGVNQED